MKFMHACIGLVAASLLSVVPAVADQQPQQTPGEQRAKSPEPVTGEIVSVNTETKTLIVKTTPDSDMKFTYSEDTQIVGADKGAEGLATKTGSLATVTYDVHGTANVALKIEVKPKQQSIRLGNTVRRQGIQSHCDEH
jgi:hypothetical protein